MGFTVEQDCPQCGAPVDLDETDHLMRCPYCSVESYLYTSSYFRFLLPHEVTGKDVFHAPYLRFRGNVFSCEGRGVGHRIVDITHVGLPFEGLPVSLGLRPQAMKMRFVSPDTKGSFLKFSLKAGEILERASSLSRGSLSGRPLHRAFIGETLSLIYLPLYVEKDRLFDAILRRPMAKLTHGEDAFEPVIKRNPQWRLTFIPSLCPNCGWNLEGDKDSVVLICGNCESAWEACRGAFVRVNSLVAPEEEGNTIYLPFWRMAVTAHGVDIDSFADFIRLTNQPRVVAREWESWPMVFWSPAFKIRPKAFLRLSKQLTISQARFRTEQRVPKKNRYPVTLPQTEARQTLKLTLASAGLSNKEVVHSLPDVRFTVSEANLTWLPFTDTGHDVVQPRVGISMNKRILAFGRQL